MTTEEKAKAYDEAIERAKEYFNSPRTCFDIEQLCNVFPELKESEDERIRKEIIKETKGCEVRLFETVTNDEFVAWLEKQGEGTDYANKEYWCEYNEGKQEILDKYAELKKQGEQKPNPCENCSIATNNCQKFPCAIRDGEQKPADKVEPKFEVGDWVVSPNGVYWHIDTIRDGRYQVSSNSGYSADWSLDANIYHRFTIQDAKPGDVLVNQNGEMPFIFKECKNNHIYCYCGYTNRKDIFFDRFVDSEGEELHWLNLYHEQAYPATKEQRDLLFQKMKEAGYEWDSIKKELKKIEQKPQRIVSAEAKESMYDKPTWSEEDEKIIIQIKKALEDFFSASETDKIKYWLNSLKDRVHPQNTWKPSDEQMNALWSATEKYLESDNENVRKLRGEVLESLYEDLKKLKG